MHLFVAHLVLGSLLQSLLSFALVLSFQVEVHIFVKKLVLQAFLTTFEVNLLLLIHVIKFDLTSLSLLVLSVKDSTKSFLHVNSLIFRLVGHGKVSCGFFALSITCGSLMSHQAFKVIFFRYSILTDVSLDTMI